MARSKTRRLGLAIAVAAPLLGACSAILGISDYEKAECAGGGACLDGDAGPGTDANNVTDAPKDSPVTFIDARGADPVSWAHFKMPNYPQDGGPTDNPMKVGPGSGPDELTESTSGYTWRKVPDGEKGLKSWSVAKTLCPAGYRLPTRIELVTLLDLTPGASVRAPAAFGLEGSAYWTTSLERSRDKQVSSMHWVVVFGTSGNPRPLGTVDEKDGSAAVICTKGAAQ